MNNEERKEYFKEYYLRSKEIKKNPDKKYTTTIRGIRGRPKKNIPPYKKTYLEEPIIMYW